MSYIMHVVIDQALRISLERKETLPILLDTTLLIILLGRRLHILNFLLLKGVERDRVQAEKRLVRVLDKDVLAVVHAKNHVDNSTNNSPSVIEVEGHLGGEVAGLVSKYTEDDVVIVVLWVGTRYETGPLLAKSQQE
jgi:hypothetical protein